MTEPKRGFWRIHLSTALILMLAASVLLWANLNPWSSNGITDPGYLDGLIYGWPVNAVWRVNVFLDRDYPDDFGRLRLEGDSYQGVAIDAAVAVLILAALTVVCEWWIRRRVR